MQCVKPKDVGMQTQNQEDMMRKLQFPVWQEKEVATNKEIRYAQNWMEADYKTHLFNQGVVTQTS